MKSVPQDPRGLSRFQWAFVLLGVLVSSPLAAQTAPVTPGAAAQKAEDARAAMLTRARSFELSTPYVPPPGDALSHHAS